MSAVRAREKVLMYSTNEMLACRPAKTQFGGGRETFEARRTLKTYREYCFRPRSEHVHASVAPISPTDKPHTEGCSRWLHSRFPPTLQSIARNDRVITLALSSTSRTSSVSLNFRCRTCCPELGYFDGHLVRHENKIE